MVRPIFRALALLSSFALLPLLGSISGCGDDSPMDPGPDGPLAGIETRPITYTVPGTGDSRSLTVAVYYPTDDTTGDASSYDENSLVGASLSPPASPAPLMVYSHGSQAWAESNHRLARAFVDAGWIVVSPDHVGNTATTNLNPRPFEFDIVRAYDVKEAIDEIENLPAGHPLYGLVDTSRVLVVGHSYGGQTSWIVGGPTLDNAAIMAACDPGCVQGELDAFSMYSFDPRVVGVVPMDGTVGTDRVADAGFAAMSVPVLFMTPDDDSGDADLFNRSTGADVTWVQFVGGCHESFTGIYPCDTLENERSVEATAVFAIAFGEMTVMQSMDPDVLGILDGTTPVDDFITLMHHPAAP